MKKQAVIFDPINLLIFVSVILLFSYATYQRNFIWKSEYSLWWDVVKKSPNKGRPHNNLGDIYNNQQRPEEAVFELKKALSIIPDFAFAHNNLGISYYLQGRYDEALASYNEAMRLKPDNANTYFNLGILYAKKGLYDKAVSYYKKALGLKSYDADTYYNLGKAYFDLGLYDKAAIEFEQAIGLNPNFSEPHLNLGVIYCYHLKNTQKALTHLQSTLKLSPNQVQAEEIKKMILKLSR